MIETLKLIISEMPNDHLFDFFYDNKIPFDKRYLSNNKKFISCLFDKLSKQNDIRASQQISTTYNFLKLMPKDLSIIVNKGFILSDILYHNPLYRISGDVDLYTSDPYKCYSYLDNKGITQENAGYFSVDEFNVNYNGIEFELHQIETTNHISKRKIGRFDFLTFDIEKTFYLLINNTYKNFYTDYGFLNDCCFRDLLDLSVFIAKYNALNTVSLSEEEQIKLNTITTLMTDIHTILFDKKSETNTIETISYSPISVYDIFNKSKRKLIYLRNKHTYVITSTENILFIQKGKNTIIDNKIYRRLWLFPNIENLHYGDLFYRFTFYGEILSLFMLIPKKYTNVDIKMVIYNKNDIYGDENIIHNIDKNYMIAECGEHKTIRLDFKINNMNVINHEKIFLFFNSSAMFNGERHRVGAIGYYDSYLILNLNDVKRKDNNA